MRESKEKANSSFANNSQKDDTVNDADSSEFCIIQDKGTIIDKPPKIFAYKDKE